MQTFFLILIAFFLGSIPNGLWITRLFYHEDIREMGSGNIGATNVLRNLGWPAAILTYGLDVGKGALAAWLGMKVFGGALNTGLAALFVIVGHCYSPWLHFNGGKGIATGVGCILAINWKFYCFLMAVFLVVVLITKIISIGSLVGATCAPIGFAIMGYPKEIVICYILAVALMFYRHKANIQRLLKGEEKGYDQWNSH